MSDDCVISGIVKRAYPLQSLSRAASTTMSSGGDELGTFGPGVGPCGPDASELVVVVVENRTTFETCFVFFYDKWATKMQFLKRHYKMRIRGRGLVALKWEAASETEERVQCVAVAERNVLIKTLERHPRLFHLPHSLSIEVTYEEPQRLPDSDQLVYLPSNTITTRDMHSAQTLVPRVALSRKILNRGKRVLDQASATSPAYRYAPLAELVSGYADIYGVVVNMTLPKKTSGRDYVMTVSVMDESCPTRAEAIQINVFYPTIAQMPKIKYVGDIIRFHKVKIQEYQGHIQGVSLPRITRHLVLRKRENDTIEQLTCSQSWTFEPSDAERTRELTKWATSCLAKDTTLPQGCPQPPKLLNELKLAENFIDLVVRVLHVEDTNEPPRLIVWDGSGDMTESDATLVSALEGHGIVVPSSGILKEVIMSSCWSVLREIGLVDGILTHWCRFRNLAVGIDEPMPGTTTASETRETLRFREVTSFVLVPDFVVDVQHRLSLITRSIPDSGNDHPLVSSTETPVDVTTIVPAHILRNIPPTSLRDILNSPHTPRKYHCYGRVRRIWPADIEKICKPKPTQKDELVYCFVLTIEDATDSLNVIVYGTHAEHFLSGIPPCDLKKSTSSKTLLEKRLTALLRAPQAFHWCIKSYAVVLPPTDCSRGPTAAIRYRLFDTRLQCL